jgi:hypothetical protein
MTRTPQLRSALVRGLLMAAGTLAGSTGAGAASWSCSANGALAGAMPARVTYSATVVTDVSISGHKYHNAGVTLTFHGNTANIYAFNVPAPDGAAITGYCIDKGDTHISITTDLGELKTKILPNQVFVSFDTYNGGIGFSSYIGSAGLEPAYPLGLLRGTVGLASDLATPTSMTGNAWSCIGYPPDPAAVDGTGKEPGKCTSPELFPIKTEAGDLVVYMPYTTMNPDGTLYGNHLGSLNRGIFSIAIGGDE